MIRIILPLALIATLTACNQTKKMHDHNTPVATEPTRPQKRMITVSGKVETIINGKDGYTATLVTADRTVYFATASIANNTDPKNYRRVAVGDHITIKGEEWLQGTEKHIIVRQFIN